MFTKKTLKNKYTHQVLVLSLGILFFGYTSVFAATIQINSSSNSLAPGATATLNVMLNSEGVAINNAEGVIKFPTDLFDVLSISKSSSIFSLWIEEPAFSNSTGLITFNGGLPTPGFNGARGSVVSVTVKAKKQGQAQFTFSDAAIRANDGLGTDVLSGKQGTTISVSGAAPIVPKIEKPKTIVAPAALAQGLTLQVSSLTHPDQNKWYKDKNPTFRWSVPEGVDAVQTTLDNTASGVPHVLYSPAISEKVIKDWKDGAWYFKVRARADGAWGPATTYIARIDTTSPQQKDVTFIYDDNAKILNISSDIKDTVSGMDHYEVFINDELVKNIPEADFVKGIYNLPYNASGDAKVRMVAYDRAGNSVESSGAFHGTSVVAPTLETIPETITADEQLLIRGTTGTPNTDINLNIKRGNEDPMVLVIRSSNDRSFFILSPVLKAGDYDIWAEVESASGNKVPSSHLHTKVTSDLLISIGSFTMAAFPLMLSLFAILVLLIVLVYYLRHHHAKSRSRENEVELRKKQSAKTLIMLKERVEKLHEILQKTRHSRILTKEEKEIKEAIERELDEVDRAIAEQNAKEN